tara:strand:+ start:11010 stop:11330 length:321 start_codon:yes stop_codon:yes gene_type:complete
MNRANRLCNAFTLNTNANSVIKAFELTTCRELNDYNGGTIIEQIKTAEDFLATEEESLDEPFYRIFAVYKKDYCKSRKAIADFYDIAEAMLFVEELTGNPVHIYSF